MAERSRLPSQLLPRPTSKNKNSHPVSEREALFRTVNLYPQLITPLFPAEIHGLREEHFQLVRQ